MIYINNEDKVTNTTSSVLSYNDAYQIILRNTQSTAIQNANNDDNIINQSFSGLIQPTNLPKLFLIHLFNII